MSTLTLYGLTKCSTCIKARQWLDANGIAHTFVDYRDHPLAPELLRDAAAQLGGWEKLVNRASMTWRNLSDAQRAVSDEAGWLTLIAAYPALVRRPLAVAADGEVGVGFSEKAYAKRFDAA